MTRAIYTLTLIVSFGLFGDYAQAVQDRSPDNNAKLTQPIIGESVVFEEQNGFLAVEAEHFFSQTNTSKRAFYLVSPDHQPDLKPDADPAHLPGASRGAYLEILPDTRRDHGNKLIAGENFSNAPGKLAILHYKVHINNPGRYYVWVRAYSTGSEDNGLHVGLDGQWPDHGQRMQWCDGKQKWFWESKQRTKEEHCGVPHEIYLDIADAGEHTISFSMREDGFEFDRWLMTKDRAMARPNEAGPETKVKSGTLPPAFTAVKAKEVPAIKPTPAAPLVMPREEDGDGSVAVTGELKKWHKVTLTQSGPFAHEQDNEPNPFRDHAMTVMFTHESGSPSYRVQGYFAADGNAAETSAVKGNKWRCHFTPDKMGKWNYTVAFVSAKNICVAPRLARGKRLVKTCNGKTGSFNIGASDKTGDDFRAHGRLRFTSKRYLIHEETGQPFFKVGPDAPETLLAFADFDDTVSLKKGASPVKTWQAHVQDWRDGDPVWQGDKGKGLIGATNYLADKGLNAFSFLTYNVGGDGANVWPHTSPTDREHFDCSKLDQWQIVFDHAQARGLFLHFKLQETENDDLRGGHKGKELKSSAALDAGKMGPERTLYLRELVARFGYSLGLEWNLGEENTQTTEEQTAMAQYLIDQTGALGQNIVLHTYPGQQEEKYDPLLGKRILTGLSLQNSWDQVHRRTHHWIEASSKTDRPWVVCNDEQNPADQGVPADPGYKGFDGFAKNKDGKKYNLDDIRKQTLWGNLTAGGAGVMYYFGYKVPENDLKCQDLRSRDKSWDYCRIANELIQSQKLPLLSMTNHDELVGNEKHGYGPWCLAEPGQVYLVYLPETKDVTIDFRQHPGKYDAKWFNPRTGEPAQQPLVVDAKETITFSPNGNKDDDWVLILRATK